jgi:hypothetical protein
MIGTPGAGTVLGRSISGGTGAFTGALVGGGPGALVGAVAPELLSAYMRQRMLSPKGQANIVPKYDKYKNLAEGLSDESVRNALIAIQAGEVIRENKNALAR